VRTPVYSQPPEVVLTGTLPETVEHSTAILLPHIRLGTTRQNSTVGEQVPEGWMGGRVQTSVSTRIGHDSCRQHRSREMRFIRRMRVPAQTTGFTSRSPANAYTASIRSWKERTGNGLAPDMTGWNEPVQPRTSASISVHPRSSPDSIIGIATLAVTHNPFVSRENNGVSSFALNLRDRPQDH
jgi:hypothetical protein